MRSFLDDLLNIHSRPMPDGPAALTLADGDPYDDIPVLLRLMCSCASAQGNFDRVVDDAAAALRRRRSEVTSLIVDRIDEHVGLVDDLRFLAVCEDSQALHDLTDRVLWACLNMRPQFELVERLELRMTPYLAHAQEYGLTTPLRRAAQIASARLSLIHILFADRTGDDQSRVIDTLAWTANRLVRAAATAQAQLDEEIEAAQDAAANAGNADAGQLATLSSSEADLETVLDIPHFGNGKDDVDEIIETAECQEGVEYAIVVLSRLPLVTNRDARKTIEPFEPLVGKPVPLVPTPDLAAVRNTLVGELPHLEGVIDTILAPLAGQRSIRLRPTLLVGRAGCGKTTLTERLMTELRIPFATYDAAGVSDAMILGSNRRWTSAAPGLLLDLITGHEIANPGVIVDELDKLGGSNRNGDLRTSLLGLFEPRRAKAFLDRFLDVPVDYSHINWLATANETFHLPSALMSRLRVLKCPMPSQQHLDALAPQMMRSELASRGLDPRWYQPLTQEELQAIRRYWKGGSIRKLKRLVNGVMAAREKGDARQ